MLKKVDVYETARIFINSGTIKLKKDKTDCAMYYYGTFLQSNNIRWCPGDNNLNMPNYCESFTFPGNIDEVLQKSSLEIRNTQMSAITPFCPMSLDILCSKCGKVPAVENIAKQGLHRLIIPVMNITGNGRYYHVELAGLVNPHERSAAGFLGVNRVVISQMAEIDITEKEFILYKRLNECCENISWDTFLRFRSLGLQTNSQTIYQILLHNYQLTPQRFISYIEKQVKNNHFEAAEVVTLYHDFIRVVHTLRFKQTESVLYPKNVKVEHDRVMKIKTDIEYEKQNQKLKKRVEILEMLSYEEKKFLIRPLRTALEFINESAVLNHCVKTYIERCANSETNIYVIRRNESPDTPFYTLTLNNNGQIQANLGKNNCVATSDVKRFADRWKKNVVNKHLKEFINAAAPNKLENNKKQIRIGA